MLIAAFYYFVMTSFFRDKTFITTSIHLSRQKTCFVAINRCLSRQNVCRVVATKMILVAAPASDNGGGVLLTTFISVSFSECLPFFFWD